MFYCVYRQSKDLNALRCQERQMLKLAEIIKTALNEVGCEELPSGCDDLSVDQAFIENNVSPDQPVSKNFINNNLRFLVGKLLFLKWVLIKKKGNNINN